MSHRFYHRVPTNPRQSFTSPTLKSGFLVLQLLARKQLEEFLYDIGCNHDNYAEIEGNKHKSTL